MNISTSQRFTKLIGNLIFNPDLIIPWVRWSLLNKKMSFEIEMPWWSFLAIEAMDRIAHGKRIFEWGSGGSTIRYGKVAEKIVSVEDDKKWLAVIREQCKKMPSVELIFAPFDFQNPVGFNDSAYLKALESSDWDVIIIDGRDYTFNERLVCFARAERFVRPGCLIIVDDFWRYKTLLNGNSASKVEVYESVGPCRTGVTSTAFFYY